MILANAPLSPSTDVMKMSPLLPVAAVDTVIDAGLAKVAPNTMTDPAALQHEPAAVRAQGFAIDNLELAPDMRCIAAPVFENGSTVPGGGAISGPSSRFDRAKLQSVALGHAEELSRILRGTF
jgi:DNA-binding IclR family transcriptional regulator